MGDSGEKSAKKWIIIAAAVILTAAVVIVCIFLINGKGKAYRSVQVYSLDGTARITREQVGTIEAYENLLLESGDTVEVLEGSSLRLKLDDDKYIMAEENTVFRLVAEGTREDSKTTIELTSGAITNEIQNPLSEQSSYEVTTPNSVMAVRGTVFRVEIKKEPDGSIKTTIYTFKGVVSSKLKHPNGVIVTQEILIRDGRMVEVVNNQEESSYVSEPEPINYEELSVDVLESLLEIVRAGVGIGATEAELESILEKKKTVTAPPESMLPPKESTKQTDPAGQPSGSGDPSGRPPEQPPKSGEPSPPPEQPLKSQEPSPPESTETSTQSTESNSQTESSQTAVYTVTFLYQGAVFGTQQVTEGQLAEKPRLSPAASGDWEYDFNLPVTSDLTISWK